MDLEIFECISEVLEEYEAKKDIYKLIAEEVKDFFEKSVFSESRYELSLIYRIKSASSIREKLIRNNYEVQRNRADKLLARMQDIIGLRIECKFIEEEKYAYALLRQLFHKTEDQIYYYMPSMPRIRLKLSEKQPQLQKNGFEIYKIDGYFMMGKETVSFELQIKALVNSFWSEIEPVSYTHLDVYKRQDRNCIQPRSGLFNWSIGCAGFQFLFWAGPMDALADAGVWIGWFVGRIIISGQKIQTHFIAALWIFFDAAALRFIAGYCQPADVPGA